MPLALKKNPDGVYHIDGYAMKRRVRKSTNTTDYAMALQEKAKIELQIAKGEYFTGSEATISNATFKFVAGKYLRSTLTGSGESTRAYVDKLCKAFGSAPIKSIDVRMVEDYIAEYHTAKGNSNSTIRRELIQLQAIINYGAELGMRDKITLKKPAEDEVSISVMTEDEEKRLFCHLHPDVARICIFMLKTGARPKEARTLTYGQVNWSDPSVELGTFKGKSGRLRLRKVLLNPDALGTIPVSSPLPSPEQLVFKVDGQPFTTRHSLYKSWSTACKNAGIVDRTPYTLRHTFATRLALANTPPKIIADCLGHTDLKMVMRYMNTTLDDQRQYIVA